LFDTSFTPNSKRPANFLIFDEKLYKKNKKQNEVKKTTLQVKAENFDSIVLDYKKEARTINNS